MKEPLIYSDADRDLSVYEAVIGQKKAHDKLVDYLSKRIDALETKIAVRDMSGYVTHLFMCKHPELVSEFVRLAYEEDPTIARYVVDSLHDETLDLSALECTGDDFKPWTERDQ